MIILTSPVGDPKVLLARARGSRLELPRQRSPVQLAGELSEVAAALTDVAAVNHVTVGRGPGHRTARQRSALHQYTADSPGHA